MGTIRKKLEYEGNNEEVIVVLKGHPGLECRKKKTLDCYGSLHKPHREADLPGNYAMDTRSSYHAHFTGKQVGAFERVQRAPKYSKNQSDNSLSDGMGSAFEGNSESRDRYKKYKIVYE